MRAIDQIKDAIARARSENLTLDIGDPWGISDAFVAVGDIVDAVDDVSKSVTKVLDPKLLQPLTQEQWNRFIHSLYLDIPYH